MAKLKKTSKLEIKNLEVTLKFGFPWIIALVIKITAGRSE